MSRIGKLPIQLEKGVTLTINGQQITVKGPNGEMSFDVPRQLKIAQEGEALTVTPVTSNAQGRALWGLWRTLLANAVFGVSQGFKKELELVGVGYRAQKKGTALELAVGYSHPVLFEAPEGIQLSIEKGVISVVGMDKQLVGQTAAKIRGVRPPEPYLGKGIRYVGEYIKLKPGKAAKAGAA